MSPAAFHGASPPLDAGGLADLDAPPGLADPGVRRPQMSDVGQQTTPDKCQIVPRTQRKRKGAGTALPLQNKFSLIEVPVENVAGAPSTRTTRHRIRTLEFWRGEKYEWERLPGSALPTPRAVLIAKDELPPLAPLERIALSPGDDSIVASPAKNDEMTPPPLRGRAGRGRGARAARQSVASAEDAMFSCAEDEDEGHVIEVPAMQSSGGRSGRGRGRGRRIGAGAIARTAVEACGGCGEGLKPRTTHCRRCGRSREEAEEAPPLGPEDLDGFIDAVIAEGSEHPCQVRMGMNTPHWLCCDIRVPPRSFNAPECLGDGRSLLISVLNDAQGSLSINLNGELMEFQEGDNLVVQAGSEYDLRNDSETDTARLKLVLVTTME